MNFKDFNKFIQRQGVIGLAIAFVLGGAVTKLVSSLVEDIVTPLLGVALGFAKNLADAKFRIGAAEVAWGSFLNALIDFFVIALVIYFAMKLLKIDNIKKEE